MKNKQSKPDLLARRLWKHRGQQRPAFAIEPGEGQESVWHYPRPPLLITDRRLVEVRIGECLIAQTTDALRVLETASPPTFYLPRDHVRMDLLMHTDRHSHCEWKGDASYFDIKSGVEIIQQAAWSYEQPLDTFIQIAEYISFYPGRVTCFVDGERVRPGFYGGWITNEIVGPYKGELGTGAW